MHEKRRHQRKPVSLSIELTYADGKRATGTCTDLSLSGARISIERLPVYEEAVTVDFAIGPHATTLSYPSTVRWTKPGEIGVQFGLLGARETYAVTELLAKD